MTSPNERRRLVKGRQTTGSFLRLPHHVLQHETFKTLSTRATKLLIDIAAQYRGNNNGDLSATLSLMRDRGWNSSDQLDKAKKELIKRDVIQLTRQGGRNKCNLYALTWFPIDECKGKLDIASTTTAPVNWRNKNASPSGGAEAS
jgi:hypothetical protein